MKKPTPPPSILVRDNGSPLIYFALAILVVLPLALLARIVWLLTQ